MSTTETTPSRGRPREFDEDQVLDALVQLFWEQGYDGSSLADIVEAAGLNKSSLYNSFGSKDELFRRVLERYIDARCEWLDQNIGDGGLDALVNMLEMMRVEALGEIGFRGCLAVNAATELGARDEHVALVATGFRSRMRESIRRPLAVAAASGEIAPDMVDVYADALAAMNLGLAVVARSGATPAELDAQIDCAVALVRSWRVPEVS